MAHLDHRPRLQPTAFDFPLPLVRTREESDPTEDSSEDPFYCGWCERLRTPEEEAAWQGEQAEQARHVPRQEEKARSATEVKNEELARKVERLQELLQQLRES